MLIVKKPLYVFAMIAIGSLLWLVFWLRAGPAPGLVVLAAGITNVFVDFLALIAWVWGSRRQQVSISRNRFSSALMLIFTGWFLFLGVARTMLEGKIDLESFASAVPLVGFCIWFGRRQ